MLVLLLGASAFAVDLGWIFLNGSRLQRAADAASLAGVVNLPVSPDGALVDAIDAAGRNGFPIALNGATTLAPSVLADNRYKVDMTTTIDTFFLRAIGFSDFDLFKTSTAEYIKPVRLGSPDNSFGDGTSDNFWAAINGQYTEKEQGDPYATRCITTPDSGTTAQCNPGFDDENQEFRDWGYFYVIEIGEGSTNLAVDIYEPSHTVDDSGGTVSDTGDLAWRSVWTDQQFVTTEFNLYRPDQTPFAPFDNSLECSQSFPRISTAGQGWQTLCSSPVSVPGDVAPGMWLLNIPSPLYEGSSKFGIRATVDGPTPKVYGLFDMSIYVNIDGGEATPFLAEVRPEHEGKTFELDIFDMGDNDGPALIQILEPDGNMTDCSWESDNGQAAPMGQCQIDISDRRFNADWLYLTIPLDGYSCDITQALGCWWKIRIQNAGQAHDRTTWTARITGNPLHLVP